MTPNDCYKTKVREITLETKEKLKPRNLWEIFKPKYGVKLIKKEIGKFSMADTLFAQNKEWNLKPENAEDNLNFLGWLSNTLIKKIDPYWNKTDKEVIDMFNEDTFLELTEILTSSIPSEVKKKSILLNLHQKT